MYTMHSFFNSYVQLTSENTIFFSFKYLFARFVSYLDIWRMEHFNSESILVTGSGWTVTKQKKARKILSLKSTHVIFWYSIFKLLSLTTPYYCLVVTWILYFLNQTLVLSKFTIIYWFSWPQDWPKINLFNARNSHFFIILMLYYKLVPYF